MNRIMRLLSLSAIIVLVVSACNLNTNPTDNPVIGNQPLVTAVEMTVQADTSVSYNTVGQIVQYRYNIKNTGTTPIPGIVTVTGATVTCPGVNTIGNLDNNLDVAETLTCTGTYVITQADLDRGSVTSITTANVNGTLSNPVTTNVPTVPNKVLTLTKTANPTTYNQVGQTITYTYLIKNSGTVILGPAQFTVSDAGIGAGAPINCGDSNATLAPNATVTCTAAFVTGQTDLSVPSIATNATASGGGAGASQPASATLTNTKISSPPGTSTLTPYTTISHTVVAGEWLWQIARCYGADPTKVILANPQLPNPAQIQPGIIVTVPNIGSVGTIYKGAHCVENVVVKNGDTWKSIALVCNADPALVQQVNPGGLIPGSTVKVPCNSAGATGSVIPTSTSSLDSTRITFAAGATSATVTGTALSGNRTVHYVLNASQGQVLTVKLTAAANSASVAIYAPNGSTLKQADLNPNWSGTLTATGDYRIDVSNALGLGAPDVPFTLEVSITGGATSNCVDVARNLNPLGPTHFNVCGTLDASGKLKVTVIHIYQKPEDVGQGGFTQDITVTDNILTPTNDANALVIADMNGDTWDDFRLLNSQPGANPTYLYFYYNITTDQFISNGVR